MYSVGGRSCSARKSASSATYSKSSTRRIERNGFAGWTWAPRPLSATLRLTIFHSLFVPATLLVYMYTYMQSSGQRPGKRRVSCRVVRCRRRATAGIMMARCSLRIRGDSFLRGSGAFAKTRGFTRRRRRRRVFFTSPLFVLSRHQKWTLRAGCSGLGISGKSPSSARSGCAARSHFKVGTR